MPHLPDTHHDHDPALIAAFAAGDATGAELSLASELVAACTACASLHDDLVTIAAAVHALPAPRRSRDYRLTGEQAGRLRPSGWRRFVAPFGGPRFRLAAPLGTTMATLGVAGLLLAAMPGAISLAPMSPPAAGGPASSVERDYTVPPEAMSSPAASAAPSMAAPQPSASATSGLAGEGAPLEIEGEGQNRADDTKTSDGQPVEPGGAGESAGPEVLAVRASDETAVIVGGTLLLLGVALLALRWTARRLV